jgi:flagellar biosynthesis protein FlhA
MSDFTSKLKGKSDALIAISVVFVILIMIVPLSSFFIDIFLTLSISLSLLILFIAMYTKKPLDFSVFPSVLLIVTLFRLSLNIASTRLILVHGDEGPQAAGLIIKGF